MSPTPPSPRIYGRSESDPLRDDFEPITSAEELVPLRESREREDYLRPVREEVPLAVLRDVIARYPDHRETVVLNKFVPVELLEELCGDEDWRLRNWIAQKRRLPEHLQLRMAADPDEVIRRSLVNNARATRRCLEAVSEVGGPSPATLSCDDPLLRPSPALG